MKNFVLLIAMLSASVCNAQETKISTTADELLATLKRPCKFNLSSATLEEVAAAVRQQFRVNVVVQDDAFEELGFKDVRVTFRTDGVSLRSALLAMMSRHDATFAIRWESIVLTTNDRADDYRRPAVYAVTDLVSVGQSSANGREEIADFDSLIALIETSAVPDTWSAVTGPSADCIGLTVGETHLLVVSQSEGAHAEIERLLTDLREKLALEKKNTEQ